MKQLILSIVGALLLSMNAFAQAPPGINYQGVARDTDGKAVASKALSVRISILKGAANGQAEYAEVHQVTTNQFGLFTLVIGQGSPVTGSFAFVSWAVGNKWLQIDMDVDGGSNFKTMGTQQLMSVPYAFYSQYSGNGLKAGNGIDITNGVVTNVGDGDNNPTNELITGLSFGSDRKLRIIDGGGTHEADLSSLVTQQTDLSHVLTAGNDAGTQKIANIGAPTVATDAANKAYVDAHNQTLTYTPGTNSLAISGGNAVSITHSLNQILVIGNDAGARKITNLAAPTVATDATTKKYVDDADAALASMIATTYAFKTAFSYVNGGTLVENNRVIPFTAEEFDDFSVLASNSFTATTAGIYVFSVDGSYAATVAGGQLSFLYNGIKYPISIVQPWGGVFGRFNSTMMFKLTAGQTVTLVGDNILVGGQFTGTFFGYKL